MMQTYEHYKDSGIDWIGQIPEDWEVKKMKFLFIDFSKKNMPNETLLSVTQNQGVVPRDWVENRMVMPSGNLDSFKYIEKGDFCISLRSFEGGLEYCFHSGIVSPAYTVLKGIFKHFDGYYKYLFKSQIFIDELQLSIVGIREGKNISYELLKYDYLPIPPIHEQEAIANFLDEKTAKIDALVQTKEQQIEKLTELRQAKIHQAVTKGLNANAPTKDSGVEWIGEIPAHWEVKRLKFIANLINEKSIAKDFKLPYYGMENIESWSGKYIESDSETEGLGNKFYKGNVLFGKLRPYLAKVHLAIENGICSSEFLVYEGKVLSNDYLKSLLVSPEFIKIINASTYGAKMPRANSDFINNQLVPIPPVQEQEQIVAYLDEVTGKIDQAVTQKQEQITKLKEYKQSLINDVVTGKVRVC